jgi:hypothetical protein
VSEVWKQLELLHAEHETKSEMKCEPKSETKFLFYVNNSGYLIPQLDCNWPSDSKLKEKMKAFYIAVGRLMGACVGKGIPIAAHVLVSCNNWLCETGSTPITHQFTLQAGLLQELSPAQLES